jgi:hypothetical protein
MCQVHLLLVLPNTSKPGLTAACYIWTISRSCSSPQQTRVRTLGADVKIELESEFVGDDSSNIVLESLYRQLFRQCSGRETASSACHDARSASEASSFRSEILASGLPPRRHLMPLYELLLRSCSMEILVSIDRIQELEELSRSIGFLFIGRLRALILASLLTIASQKRLLVFHSIIHLMTLPCSISLKLVLSTLSELRLGA